MKLLSKRTICFIVLTLCVVGLGMAGLTFQVLAQDDLVATLRQKLVQQNVPVKSLEITGRLPFQVRIVLQSASAGKSILPDDAISAATAAREVHAARRHGTKIDQVAIVILNQQGDTICFREGPVDTAVDTVLPQPSTVDDRTVAESIRGQLHLAEVSLDKLDVTRNTDGAQEIRLVFSAQSAEAANQDIPLLMGTLASVVGQLRSEQGANIALYQVNLYDRNGQAILKYVRDYLASEYHENWWQAPGVTKDWFPHPPEPTPTTS
ncbi:MAG TPA: hypothetical protein PLG21_18690 [Anaerolineae bacterium]|nr:hypothetical protein [Anaerolineae bacterium]